MTYVLGEIELSKLVCSRTSTPHDDHTPSPIFTRVIKQIVASARKKPQGCPLPFCLTWRLLTLSPTHNCESKTQQTHGRLTLIQYCIDNKSIYSISSLVCSFSQCESSSHELTFVKTLTMRSPHPFLRLRNKRHVEGHHQNPIPKEEK